MIRSLLRKDPEERILSEDILLHPWMTVDENRDFTKSSSDQLVPDIFLDGNDAQMIMFVGSISTKQIEYTLVMCIFLNDIILLLLPKKKTWTHNCFNYFFFILLFAFLFTIKLLYFIFEIFLEIAQQKKQKFVFIIFLIRTFKILSIIVKQHKNTKENVNELLKMYKLKLKKKIKID